MISFWTLFVLFKLEILFCLSKLSRFLELVCGAASERRQKVVKRERNFAVRKSKLNSTVLTILHVSMVTFMARPRIIREDILTVVGSVRRPIHVRPYRDR